MKPLKKLNLKWLSPIAIVVLFSCQKEISNPDTVAKNVTAVTNTNVNVYVSGMEGKKPIYWKKGSPVYLSNLGMPKTTCIAVSGNDVYVGGFMNHISLGTSTGSGFNALYFKNGIRLDLAYGTRIASANSIVVSGSDVYVAGTVNTML